MLDQLPVVYWLVLSFDRHGIREIRLLYTNPSAPRMATGLTSLRIDLGAEASDVPLAAFAGDGAIHAIVPALPASNPCSRGGLGIPGMGDVAALLLAVAHCTHNVCAVFSVVKRGRSPVESQPRYPLPVRVLHSG